MQRAPFRWYEVEPTLQKGAVDMLMAMAKQADASLQAEFGIPLGLIIIDTIAASAGYNEMAAESDNATCQHVLNVLNQVAQQMRCCVLGVDHFGKNIKSGTRGGSAKKSSAEVVLAILGRREVSGRVVDTKVALRKVRGAPQGEEFYFTVRSVDEPEPGRGREAVPTLVVEWQPGPPKAGQVKPRRIPWQEKQQDGDTPSADVVTPRAHVGIGRSGNAAAGIPRRSGAAGCRSRDPPDRVLRAGGGGRDAGAEAGFPEKEVSKGAGSRSRRGWSGSGRSMHAPTCGSPPRIGRMRTMKAGKMTKFSGMKIGGDNSIFPCTRIVPANCPPQRGYQEGL